MTSVIYTYFFLSSLHRIFWTRWIPKNLCSDGRYSTSTTRRRERSGKRRRSPTISLVNDSTTRTSSIFLFLLCSIQLVVTFLNTATTSSFLHIHTARTIHSASHHLNTLDTLLRFASRIHKTPDLGVYTGIGER